MQIPIHYDPMIAKLVVHAPSRIEAIEKMKMAIDAYEINGVDTTLEFGKFAITHPDFVSGKFDTNFVNKNMGEFTRAEEEIDQTLSKFAAWLFEKKKSILVLPDLKR
jgi:propionyl-CoA carboxylase alpha chain